MLAVCVQVMAFSATYTPPMMDPLQPLMHDPQHVTISPETVSLLGVLQFHQLVQLGPGQQQGGPAAQPDGSTSSASTSGLEDGDLPATSHPDLTAAAAEPAPENWATAFEEKVRGLLRVFTRVLFHQAVLFCNRKEDAEALAQRLVAAGYPSAYISGKPLKTFAMPFRVGSRVRPFRRHGQSLP